MFYNFNVDDFFALSDLYNSTSGEFWIWELPYEINGFPWFNNSDPCSWQAILCGDNNTYIKEINLIQYNLKGFLPNSIGSFTQLETLIIAYNDGLFGSIPIEIGNLENLQYLYLDNNNLSGSIPDNLNNLTNLLLIDLSANNLSGEIFNFSKLERLYWLGLDFNFLTGAIPNSFENLKKLKILHLYDNKISGSVPNSLKNCILLQSLSIDGNFISGDLPDELFTNMTSLNYLIVNDNFLTSSIPNSIKNSINLIDVHLSNNMFSSSLPNILGEFKKINLLLLEKNYFSGSVPNLSKLENLKILLLNNNKFSGNLDKVFDPKMKDLEVIEIFNNQITGLISESIFQLKNLNTFIAHVNCFSNQLPQSICNTTNIQTLILNGLSSASSCRKKIIPGIFKSYYTEKKVFGKIDKCIFDLKNLSTLQLSGNGLSGNIEIESIGLKLTSLSLSHNKLTGYIPKIIQEKRWKILDVSYNYFSGILMDSFNTYGEINDTQTYSLQNNYLSGVLPSSVIELENINILDGNLFNCDLDRKNLPKNDINVNKYQCGSNSFNIEYCLFIGLLSIFSLIFFKIKYRVSSVGRNSLNLDLEKNTNDINTNKIIYLEEDPIVLISKKFTFFIVFLLLPFYVISSIYSGTYNNQYIWIASAAFLKGIIVFIFLFIFFSCLIIKLFLINNNQIYNSTVNTSSKRVSFIYIIINLLVVISINCVYVYTMIYQNNNVQIVSQIMLSCFKILWNSQISPYILKNISMKINKRYSETEYIFIKIFVSFFNNIIIPMLVVMCISPNCFYNVLIEPPEVQSSYEYEFCVDFSISSGSCSKTTNKIENSSFEPQFDYSYACSGSIVTHYAGPFLIMCIITIFVIPSIQMLLKHYKCENNYILKYFIICKSQHKTIINIMSYFGLLISFGIVFPPLAVALLLSIIVISYSIKYEKDDLINNQIISSMWMLIIISILFYTLFLFDILGLAVGFKYSYWILIFSVVCCVLTLIFWLKSRIPIIKPISDEIFNILL
uniref:Leucine-rich repeat-containing N-terminal plant-type domain-containing protein n=1 Tax=viral metagenome TaxID=1070528 RepID=A0A6C0ADX4_9ZZZZ